MTRTTLLAVFLLTACAHPGGAPPAAASDVSSDTTQAEPARPATDGPGFDPTQDSAAKADPAAREVRRAEAKAAERRLAAAADPDEERLYQLERARELFQAFIARTEGKPEFDEPLQRARERVADIGAEIEFVRQGLAERGLREAGQAE